MVEHPRGDTQPKVSNVGLEFEFKTEVEVGGAR